MANSTTTNPIILDTFTSAIDLGDSLFGDTNAPMKISEMVWEAPTTVAHEATVKDGGGNVVFYKKCAVAHNGGNPENVGWVRGLTVDISGVGSGKIIIRLE